MDIKSIASLLQQQFQVTQEKVNTKTEELQVGVDEDKNYYLEKEIEDVRKRWEIFKYVDTKFQLFEKEPANPTVYSIDIDLKNIRNLKALLFNRDD